MSVQRAMALIQGKQSVIWCLVLMKKSFKMSFCILCLLIEDSVSETPESAAQASPEIQERLRKQLKWRIQKEKGRRYIVFFYFRYCLI